MERTFTTQPIEASTGVSPEFVDLARFERMFSVGRSSTYGMIQRGEIRSVVLRREGCVKGRRLISVQSARDFFSSLSGDVDPRLSELNRKAQKISAQKKMEKKCELAKAEGTR